MSFTAPSAAPSATTSPTLPRTVIVLGVVSLLMDLSSETIHALLPLFLVNGLGVGIMAIGLLDGAAEALTLAIKPWAGRLSDRLRQRKPLTLAGYGLSALTKPLFALANGFPLVVLARSLDRVGKGLRGAPRDALIADVTPPAQRGAAYGLRQALDTVGALLAPLAAAGLLWAFSGDYRAVFWLASLPAFAAVLLLAVAIREPAHPDAAVSQKARSRTTDSDHRTPGQFPREFWWLLGFAGLITLARPGEAFLILRGHSLALGDSVSALLLAAMNLSYAGSVWPVGRYFDRIGATRLLGIGLTLLLLSQLVLALASNLVMAFTGALLLGLHLGFSQGVLAALVARYAPASQRGTAFGWYAVAVGSALLLNGLLFGALWQHHSPALAFSITASLAAVSLLLFAVMAAWQRRAGQ